MTCIVAYDIEDNKIRNQIAKYLLSMGVRLQKSVFAIKIERHAFARMSKKLEKLSDKKGRIAIFRLCAGCQKNAIQMNDDTPQFYVF
ncbi:MAG: CRISPR-associated endonuclease Cas2 [Deltaproteobacteria bacterium]|nr:CRISPR-associated endonuclease Cas2 [Deltaproteobacteria bacterium]